MFACWQPGAGGMLVGGSDRNGWLDEGEAEIRDLGGATSNGGHGGGGGLAVDSGQNRRLQGGKSAITGGCNLSYTNRDLAGRH